MFKKSALLLNSILLFIALNAQNSYIPVVPSPQFVEKAQGSFKIDKDITIIITGNDTEKNSFAAREIQKAFGDNAPQIKTMRSVDNSIRSIVLEQIDSLKLADSKYPKLTGEGYYLTIVRDRITIRAFKPSGIFYGAISLIQILEKATNKEIFCMKIIDWPDMKIRGISDDISRGQVSTMENFKKIIDNMARYKMNTYMPYLEDMIQFDAFPAIGKYRGALSKAEVKELIAYASNYFIEIIPIFQTLGHYENILSQDEFIKYAEFPGAASLNVSSDSTYIFLESMLKEVFDIFPSHYFHMGADESYDVGLGKSKSLVDKYNAESDKTKHKKNHAKNGQTDKEDNDGIAIVHANHYKKVYDICKKYNKKVLMYSDIVLQYPKIIELLPKDIIMVDWHYNPQDDYKSAKTFSDVGFKYIVSPAVWNFYAVFPVNAIALPNIQHLTESGIENNSIGMINSNWGDYGAETFKELIYFGYAWSAQCSWNLKNSDISSFSRNYFYDFFGNDDSRNTQIYQTLSDPLNQVPWHEVWRHPLLPFRDPPAWEGRLRSITVKTNWMDWTLPMVSDDIDKLKAVATKNTDHYELLKYIVSVDRYFKYKAETQLLLAKKLNKTDVDIPLLLSMIDKNISLLSQLRDDYKKLWLLYYKEDNLNMITDKFNRLIAYFSEAKEAVIADKLQAPLIKSDWIYMKIEKNEFADKAVFKKEFILESKPDSALLQLMGDTYAKLFINGQYVEQVNARRTLSLLVDYKRIKLIDIAKYLKDSLNIIEVHCENYNTNEKAGFNIYSEIYLKDRTKALISDNSWAAKLPESEKWIKSTSQEYPKLVIAPNFKTRRISWIER